MKKILLCLLFIVLATRAQWQLDVRLTNDPSFSFTSLNNAKSIASSGNFVCVVWHDLRNQQNNDGNYEIYYKSSTSAGVSWGTDTRLTINPAVSSNPSISLSGSFVHVVWWDSRDGNGEIYYKSSSNEGVNWGSDIRLTANSSPSSYPSITLSGSDLHVVWVDRRDGNDEIYYKFSTNNGMDWGTDIRLTNNSEISGSPSIFSTGLNVHCVWHDLRDGGAFEIYYKQSTDGGINWGTDKRLTVNSATSVYSSIEAAGPVLHVVWQDARDGHWQLYYKRSADNGLSWDPDTRLTNTTLDYFSLYPSISVSFPNVHVVWQDNRDGNDEVYCKRSTNNGLSWETEVRLTDNAEVSNNPFISVSGSAVHVLWRDRRNIDDDIYYKRNPTGNEIGIINISSEVPNEFFLFQNYPNPFNPSTHIGFRIAEFGWVRITVYDVLGKEVQILVNRELSPGIYEVDFDGSNLPSGVYYYKLEAGSFSVTNKMAVIK